MSHQTQATVTAQRTQHTMGHFVNILYRSVPICISSKTPQVPEASIHDIEKLVKRNFALVAHLEHQWICD